MGAVPTALREREDDILPYGGCEILADTIQPGVSKCYCFLTQKRYRVGQGTCWIRTGPKGVIKKFRLGLESGDMLRAL